MRYNFEDLKQKVETSRRFDNNKRVLPVRINKPIRDIVIGIFPEVGELFDILENEQWHDELTLCKKNNPNKKLTVKFNYGIVENCDILRISEIDDTVISHRRKCKNENIYFQKKNNNKPYQGEAK
jgi:hypothetical protein